MVRERRVERPGHWSAVSLRCVESVRSARSMARCVQSVSSARSMARCVQSVSSARSMASVCIIRSGVNQ